MQPSAERMKHVTTAFQCNFQTLKYSRKIQHKKENSNLELNGLPGILYQSTEVGVLIMEVSNQHSYYPGP